MARIVKIISKGSAVTTTILDDKGNSIENCTSIDWHVEVDGIATVTMKFIGVEVEVEGEQQ
jgi:hypothetical protein